MGLHTDIEWCDSTLNLQMGCDGCELWRPRHGVRKCYAGSLTWRMLSKGPARGWPKSFDQPAIFPERMDEAEKWPDLTHTKRADKPWLDGLPRMIFLNDMGDTFTNKLDVDWLAPFLPRMADTPHAYLLLTKRAHSMKAFFEGHPCPPNVGVGTSITNDKNKFLRLAALLDVKAPWHFVSVEPMWEFVDLRPFLQCLDWCIFGGESGDNPAACDITWFAHEIADCKKSGVPCFIKQLGANANVLDNGAPERVKFRDPKGGDWSEWPQQFRVREMPRAVIPRRMEQPEFV